VLISEGPLKDGYNEDARGVSAELGVVSDVATLVFERGGDESAAMLVSRQSDQHCTTLTSRYKNSCIRSLSKIL
jgi:hypothetical protein